MNADIAILVVEDHPGPGGAAAQALRGCGDPVLIGAAADGIDALDYLFGSGAHDGRDVRKQPRLVILDVNLTRMHGLDVLKAMRGDSRTQAVPVIMLSASVEKAELEACYAAGANSVVHKSGDAQELRAKMRQVYEFWVTVNEANRQSRV